MPAKDDKKQKGVEVARCPRCGSELHSTSDMDLAGHYVRCPRCGFTDDLISHKPHVVTDIDMEGAARPM